MEDCTGNVLTLNSQVTGTLF